MQLENTTPEDAPFKSNSLVRVKLSGDSTNMGKSIPIEFFSYMKVTKHNIIAMRPVIP